MGKHICELTRIPVNLPTKMMLFNITCIGPKSSVVKPLLREHKSLLLSKIVDTYPCLNNNLAMTLAI